MTTNNLHSFNNKFSNNKTFVPSENTSNFDPIINFRFIKDNLELNYINNLIKTCDKNNIDKNILLKRLEERENEQKEEEKKKHEEEKKKQKEENDKKELSLLSPTSIGEISPPLLSSKSNQDSPTNNFSDDYLYQKPWTKLTAIHKIIKIKEFITQLGIENDKERAEIKDKLIELVKTKILTKKDSVIYDPVKAKIISIQLLQFKNGKYFI